MWIIVKLGADEGKDGEIYNYAAGAIGPFESESEAKRFIAEKLETKDKPWGADYEAQELEAP